MKLNKYLWALIKAKFKQFCAHCTLHGAYYFSDGSRWWLRGLWIFIVCCSMGLCCFLSHMIWNKFVIDPTLTVVETTHYSTADIPFPAVTVCDTEMVHGPNTENVTNLLILRGYTRSQVAEFYQSFSEVQNKDYAPAVYVKKMHYLLNDLGLPLKTLLEMFKKPCDEILLDCSWRSRPHNCSEMFRSVYTVKGYCCQFDVPYFKTHTTTETNFISGVQATEALDVIVSGTKISADGIVTDGHMLLYVFDLKDKVTLIDNAVILTPAAYFDINVFMWAIDSSTYVKALSLEARKCILDTGYRNRFPAGVQISSSRDICISGSGFGCVCVMCMFPAPAIQVFVLSVGLDPRIGTSFYDGCITRLILKQVVSQCRCLPFEYSAEELDMEDYPTCTWDRLICIYQTIDKIQADVRDIISQNECYQRCDYVQYEAEVEFIKNQRNLRDKDEIHSRVSVHFTETTCMKYRREVLYTWDQMLANLGGIFGLCLGGSIVSVMELIWFIFDLIFTIIHEAYTKKKVDPKVEPNKKYKNNVFIINQSIPKEANKTFKNNEKDLKSNKLGKSSGEVRFKFIN